MKHPFEQVLVAITIAILLTSCAKQPSSVENSTNRSITKQTQSNPEFVWSGRKWTNKNVSVSFMPDGTAWEGNTTNLFTHLDTVAPREVWTKEYARAFAYWAKYSNLNFHFVSDTGAAFGTPGAGQADLRFGDIRLGGYPISQNGYTGYTYFPYSGGSSSLYGDMKLNTIMTSGWKIGTPSDLFSHILHESGHGIGLDHSSMGTVMFGIIMGVYSDLTADDIAGVQSVYGARTQDSYDALNSNDSPLLASPVTVTSSVTKFINADLTSNNDLDYYRLVVPAGALPVLSVTALGGQSLLTPRLTLYDEGGNLINQVSASDYGQGALIQLEGLAADDVIIIGVDSPVEDEFGMGMYRLAIEFRSSADGVPYVPPTFLNPDSRETNRDSLDLATDLGQTSNLVLTGLNIHWTWDEDYYSFKTVKSANTYEVNVAYTSGTAPLEIEIYNTAGNKIAQSNGANFIRFPASGNTVYKAHIYCPTNLVRGYNMQVKKYN